MKAVSTKVKMIQPVTKKKNPKLHQRCQQSEMAAENRDMDAVKATTVIHPYCYRPYLQKSNAMSSCKKQCIFTRVISVTPM